MRDQFPTTIDDSETMPVKNAHHCEKLDVNLKCSMGGHFGEPS
jgi:hypothetical protein